MNGADTEGSAPSQYNRKNRPAWYSGVIVAGPSKAPIGFVYAGMAYKGDVYTATDWNGTKSNQVPATFFEPITIDSGKKTL